MALAVQLQNQVNNLSQAPEAIRDPILQAKDDFNNSFNVSTVKVKVGDRLPPFRLPDATGKTVSSDELLQTHSSLLVTFYRGEWCPFCNLALAAHQENLPEYHARKTEFVAISPELPNNSLTLIEKSSLKFPVLSDLNLEYAKELGIVFRQAESVRPAFGQLGIDLDARNGNDSYQLPIPISLLVDSKGIIRNIFVHPDFTKRLEPAEALKWIDQLKN